MSLDDVAELFLYWGQHPPVHVLLGSVLGALGTARPPQAGATRAHVDQVAAMQAQLGPAQSRATFPCRMQV